MRLLLLITALVWPLSAGTVIDRVAVIVGRHVIKASDIDQDLRVTKFMNREPLIADVAARKASAARLIDQQIIRQELSTAGYATASDADAKAMLKQFLESAYGNARGRLAQALQQYGLTEEQLRTQLQWQVTVLRFIDQRFRGGVLVTDDEARNYYNLHRTEFKSDFETATPSIRTLLEGEQVNGQFETWLEETRARTPIEYREEAFR